MYKEMINPITKDCIQSDILEWDGLVGFAKDRTIENLSMYLEL